MTHVRSMTAATCLAGLVTLASVGAWTPGPDGAGQGAIVDEGAFRISRGGGAATEVESFRISRGDNGQFVATSQLSAGTRRVNSRLVADSLGTPISYELTVLENRAKTSYVLAGAQAGRLATRVTNQGGDESDRDYPMGGGRERTVILDDELVHQLYFSGLSNRSG